MHNESPLAPCRAESCSADDMGRVDRWSTEEKQPSMARLYNSASNGVELQRQRAKRTAMWVGAVAVLVYVGFILSGVIGR
ncbi:hypothetical protein FJU31_15200 [Stenotrophomonas cyclobalanopsidis]|uniref:Transmembrane protein n=1 Tax=Stenotrophomonas cyclobalanopsidis TaxID=2771362 RepID=A0ABQ6SXY9_9GAMM|nr:hypothetical protein FJU31_15200 [Stenotrophomonas cyclobalanopsidis]